MYAQSTVLSSFLDLPASAGFNQKPGSRLKLPGSYDFRMILKRIIQSADTYMPTPQP